jgi:hypothetical protein
MTTAPDRRLRRGPLITLLATAVTFGGLMTASALSHADHGSPPSDRSRALEPSLSVGVPSRPGPQPSARKADRPLRFYYGHTEDWAATVAVVVDNERASAYVCWVSGVEIWLDGASTPGRIRLTGARTATARGLRARVSPGVITGTVRYAGVRVGFSATRARPAAKLASYPGEVGRLTRSRAFTVDALGARR